MEENRLAEEWEKECKKLWQFVNQALKSYSGRKRREITEREEELGRPLSEEDYMKIDIKEFINSITKKDRERHTITYYAEFDSEEYNKEYEKVLKRKAKRKEICEELARFYAGNDKQLACMYYVAFQAAYRKIPSRDYEDVIQEIITAYLTKQTTEEFMFHLIAKEKIVQYYRRGRIENRNYRNILLTRQYYQYDEKTGSVSWTSKYDDSEEEGINYEILTEEEGQESFEEITIDKLLIQSLPKRHRELALKRFNGEKLTDSERSELSRYQRRLRESIQ